jgi:hypothetical protein
MVGLAKTALCAISLWLLVDGKSTYILKPSLMCLSVCGERFLKIFEAGRRVTGRQEVKKAGRQADRHTGRQADF